MANKSSKTIPLHPVTWSSYLCYHIQAKTSKEHIFFFLFSEFCFTIAHRGKKDFTFHRIQNLTLPWFVTQHLGIFFDYETVLIKLSFFIWFLVFVPYSFSSYSLNLQGKHHAIWKSKKEENEIERVVAVVVCQQN